MKHLKLAWTAPTNIQTDYFAVLIDDTVTLTTHATECDLPVQDDFDHGRLSVQAVVGGEFSMPCTIWYEVFDLFIGWDDAHGCVIVTLPTVAGRWYALERKTEGDWTEFATIPGTGQVESVGGGTFKHAWFRAWSK